MATNKKHIWISVPIFYISTQSGLLTSYGVKDLGQHWQHQAITWTNIDWSSVKSSDIHIRAISQEMNQPSITKFHLRITYLIVLVLTMCTNFATCTNITQVQSGLYMYCLNTLRPIRSWRDFTDDIFKCIFLTEKVLILITLSLKLTLFQHWFR